MQQDNVPAKIGIILTYAEYNKEVVVNKIIK